MKRQEQSLHRWPHFCYAATTESERPNVLSILCDEGEQQQTSVRFFGGSTKCRDVDFHSVVSRS